MWSITASFFSLVTSRKPKVDERDGQMYSFMSRSEMECDIKNGRFLEHGEYDGNLYGTKINSIHEVMETGKICILDVNPQVEEGLHTVYHLTVFHFFSTSPTDTFFKFCIPTHYLWLVANVFCRLSTSLMSIKNDLLMSSIMHWKRSTNLFHSL